MPYATQADIEERAFEELERLVDYDDEGQITAASVQSISRALGDASDEIDSYLGQRYKLPLATVPNILKLSCIDLALYNLARGPRMRDDLKERRDRQVKWLALLAKGDVSLGIPVQQESPPPHNSGIIPFTNDFAGWRP